MKLLNVSDTLTNMPKAKAKSDRVTDSKDDSGELSGSSSESSGSGNSSSSDEKETSRTPAQPKIQLYFL